jgi:serine/threonine protein kinase
MTFFKILGRLRPDTHLPDFDSGHEQHEYVKTLGKGGQGYVGLYYRPDAQGDDDDHVAVKFPINRPTDDFGREVGMLSQVDTRHIVKHEKVAPVIFSDGDRAVGMFTEFCDGGALGDKFGKDRMSTAQAASHMAQTTLGLRDSGFVHGDIKPDNILIKENVTKVGDWGSAHPPGYHIKGFIGGTYGYHSPECVQCPPLDEKRDVYAVAASGYEMVSGERWRKLPRKDMNDFEVQHAILTDDRKRSVNDPTFDTILDHATRPKPSQRSSSLDLLADLSIYPEARAHYSNQDRLDIAKHLVERSQSYPERNPDLDQAAAAGLLQEWSGGKGLKQQLGQLARGPEAREDSQQVVTRVLPEQLSPATQYRGVFVSIQETRFKDLDSDRIAQEANAWKTAAEQGEFSQKQLGYIRNIKERCQHAEPLSGDLPQRVAADLTDAQRTKELRPGEAFVRVDHKDGTWEQGVGEGVAGGIVKHGAWAKFTAHDKLAQVAHHDHSGRLHGEVLDLAPDGSLAQRTDYDHGLRHGTSYSYDVAGRALSRREYQDGVEVGGLEKNQSDMETPTTRNVRQRAR